MGKSDDTTTFTIGELARRFGLNVRTLRYYESVELLSLPARSDGGYRLYTTADEERLRFVLQAKRVGFRLYEIREIIRLGQHGKACDYVRNTLSRHLERVEAQIAELQAVRGELSALQAAWQEPGKGGTAAGQLCRLIEEWSSPIDKEHETMTTGKRQVEVFIAGCPLCEPVVEMVQRLACTNCEVTIHNVKDDVGAVEQAKVAGVVRVPMVLVDGKPAQCCTSSGAITEEGLRAAGVGGG